MAKERGRPNEHDTRAATDQTDRSRDALRKLAEHSGALIEQSLPQIIRDFANSSDVSDKDKFVRLVSLLNVIIDCIDDLGTNTKIEIDEFWTRRDKSLGETPFSFLFRVYERHLKSKNFSKSTIKACDKYLYKALSSKFWREKAKHEAEYFDRTIKTKAGQNDFYVELLPKLTARTQDAPGFSFIDELARIRQAMRVRAASLKAR